MPTPSAVQLSSQEKFENVRKIMAEQGVDALIVPYTDAFQSQNKPAPGSGRLRWLTDFRGSAGHAIIFKDKAILFVDSRYSLSSRAQVDDSLIEVVDELKDQTPVVYACAQMKKGACLGYDPFLHTADDVKKFEDETKAADVTLTPLTKNPIDAVRLKSEDEVFKAIAHDEKYAGCNVADKISDISKVVKDAGHDVVVLSYAASVSWLLNIRVPEIPVTPLVHGYVLLDAAQGHAHLYTDVDCSDSEILKQFGDHVSVNLLSGVEADIKALVTSYKNWCVDDSKTPYWFRHTLNGLGANVVTMEDPCLWPRALKNKVERDGIRSCHIRDGVAITKLLHHIDTHQGKLNEREIEKLVLEFRAQDSSCFNFSFEPIVGFNANGAFVHGQVPDEQVKVVGGDGLLLIDSGGQYMDGTTDITRTLAIGTPDDEMKRCFTTVMKGHIALARAVFPDGTAGVTLDGLTRTPIWAAGLDYGHGTGHGVGYCSNVHEGPCNFGPKPGGRADAPLREGVLISIEPGYYREGAFGIRHENLYLVVPHDNEGFLQFEPVTFAPFDTRGLDVSLLSEEEKSWLNDYHAHVFEKLSPHLDKCVKSWLETRSVDV